MNFENGDLFHVYNQGNNRIPVFYSPENYFLFLRKIKLHILPHADVVAWCLMPNHFHLMLYVHTLELIIKKKIIESAKIGCNGSSVNCISQKKLLLNDSIGTLLSSFTRAVNDQQDRTGSLFRVHTHAECLTTIDLHTPSFFDTPYGTNINRHFPDEEYPKICFDYIHNNPVKAGIVKDSKDWEFSSYPDYYGNRNGKLINKKRTEEFGLI